LKGEGEKRGPAQLLTGPRERGEVGRPEAISPKKKGWGGGEKKSEFLFAQKERKEGREPGLRCAKSRPRQGKRRRAE